MIKHVKLFTMAVLIFISLNIAAVSAVDEVYLGNSVDLRGSCTSDYIYLFVTGPNLPSNGANPENIHEEVVSGDESTFVVVKAFNNRWSYTWDSRTGDGVPDAGIYTFYAVERPLGRNDLSGAEYSARSVKLIDPSISVSSMSSSENSGYSISSETQEKTATPTATKKVTTSPTTVKATQLITATPTVTPAAGIPSVILILSLVLSLFIVISGKRRS
ncbi:hypothetical protein [Methanolacinia petrolearia]|uniref:hypothetical protein n=1 Tax=Methanolacinia petrolearia TaxID=54120 RepID=UPI003BAB5FFC